MRIQHLIYFFLILGSNSAKSQAPPSIPFLTKSWELIAEKYYKENGKGKVIPVFPPALQALENKPIELPGYMIPIKAGMMHNVFFISVLPLYQCDYCGKGGIPLMVEVHLTKAIPFTDSTIKIRGRLVLNTSGDTTFDYSISEVIVTDAELVN